MKTATKPKPAVLKAITVMKTKQLYNVFRILGSRFSDFLFPKICLFCRDRIIFDDLESKVENLISTKKMNLISTEYFCFRCKSKIEFAPHKDEILNDLTISFPKNQLAISNAVSLFANSDDFSAMNLIYKFKYYGFTRIGIEYGIWLGKILLDYDLVRYDFIVPVPLHRTKKRERGYNQADFIAVGVSKILDIPVAKNLLKKVKHTVSQTSLKSDERKINLWDAFRVNPSFDLRGKKILLVDDVLTTGSTVNTCALVLLENSASLVDIATLVKA